MRSAAPIAEQKVAAGMGSRARTLFAEGHTRMLVGAPDGDPKEVLPYYVRGKLATGDNISGQ